jgi:hypothetical protein
VYDTHDRGSAASRGAEVLLKCPEALLPNVRSFLDKDGHPRHEARLRWWDPTATTFRTAALGMEGHEANLPDAPVPAKFLYSDETPVLFGHYWMGGTPRILNQRASCLDFSAPAARGHRSQGGLSHRLPVAFVEDSQGRA